MARSLTLAAAKEQLKNAETEIAVLQVQFRNLDEKVDDLRTDIKDVRENIASASESTQALLKGFQDGNNKAHRDLALKISAIEKWKWMMMGAGIVIGSLGWPLIANMLGM